jgi:hypothetical protein
MKITGKLPLLLVVAIVISIGFEGCKSQKKIAQEKAAAEYARKVEEAKKDLTAIINDDGSMSLAEKESKLRKVKRWNLNDPEVLTLIRQAEEKIAEEKAEIERKKQEELASKLELSTSEKLNNYFNDIAYAPSVDVANQNISEALQLFSASNVPVLIIISEEGGITDYDKPTTISKYLNYLKDQKKNINAIKNIGYDENGKIVELELIKK